MILLWLTFCLLLFPLWESVIVLCFVVCYFMSVLELKSSWCGRESWLLCLICLPGVSWWLSYSSSRCHGVVCSLWSWYFLIILPIFAQFSLFESKFDRLIPYVNESKSLRRVFGQDPLICHRFRSSQRWWYFSPFSWLGKREQFCSIFAVWVQIWPPNSLCKWKQMIEESVWTGLFNLP